MCRKEIFAPNVVQTRENPPTILIFTIHEDTGHRLSGMAADASKTGETKEK